ncbi:MAG: DUF805 domain-containing protein [Rhodanobacteraceae bacterium]
MDWKSLLFSFEGRVGRGAYWGLVVVSVVLFGGLATMSVMSALNSPDPAAAGGGISVVTLIASLVFLWPALAIQAKRWHDVDKSAWWILINLVPAVGGLIALVFNGFIAGTPATNRFGPAPSARPQGRAATASA